MKQILLLAFVALTFASCQQNSKSATDAADSTMASSAADTSDLAPRGVADADAPVITFENATYNFGTIAKGEKVSYSYKFKNTGKTPLIITNAEASCGCTVPEIPKEPIKPGAESEIKVVFDSTGKSGLQDKVVTISSNASPGVSQIHLTGEIKE